METLLGLSLADVRVHSSPVAETLGAEAFTTGRRIVFAPGRLDVVSGRGLALLAHELTHLGQPLAFKQLAGAGDTPIDAEEGAARQQEAAVQRIVENGWPDGPPMELRRAAPPPSPLVRRDPGAETPATDAWSAPPTSQMIQRAPASEPAVDGVGPHEPVPIARLSAAAAPAEEAAGGAASPDVALLARQVYAVLRAQLRAERDRHRVYSR